MTEQSTNGTDHWRDRPCAKCGAENPEYTSPEWNLCSGCNSGLRERYGNV
jgi:hypothetical protein